MKTKLKFITKLFLIITLIFAFSMPTNIVKASENKVYLGGFTCGFSLTPKGAMVIGLSEVIGENGLVSPSKCAGIQVGDVILSINGKKINKLSEINGILEEYNQGYLIVEVSRNNKKMFFDVFPEKDISGKYKIGVFIRDDLSGIGTITYYKEDGNFASLGHPVANEKGEIIQIAKGSVFNSTIIGVNKGVKGKAGELKGLILGEKSIGEIYSNKEVGMFGKFYNTDNLNGKEIETARARIGKAKIYSTVDGTMPKLYDIDIIKADFFRGNTKNLVIRITDEKLLKYTGGILQGMSGSPIIQDNKLVGAVTHVFINDSSRGYGIAIENMLKHS